jgi:hypothetical protein
MTTHEVFIELSSGTRLLVGTELADVRAASELATRWKGLAEHRSDELHETQPGSGVVVRGGAIVAIKAQQTPKPGPMGGVIKIPRDGAWL